MLGCMNVIGKHYFLLLLFLLSDKLKPIRFNVKEKDCVSYSLSYTKQCLLLFILEYRHVFPMRFFLWLE